MVIKEIIDDKMLYMDLLLLADEQEDMLINRHLDQDPLIGNLPRIEFCDDGFSGTNFDRPDFAKMIEFAEWKAKKEISDSAST